MSLPQTCGPAARAGIPMLAAALLAAAALSACAGAPPTHFYSLMPAAASGAPAPPSGLMIDIVEVEVPAQVDVPQLVVRTGGEELVPVETRRWIAPLTEEIREALAAGLGRRLGAADVHGLNSGATGVPVYRVDIAVRRFDSVLGGYARIDAFWTLAPPGPGPALDCLSSVTEPVGDGYEALVAGHQRALARIADAVAAGIAAAHSGARDCPHV